MKGFRTYEIFFNSLYHIQEFANGLIMSQIWFEVVPAQLETSTVIVHIRQGDNKQYRDILDICIKQNIVFDIHGYRRENENE